MLETNYIPLETTFAPNEEKSKMLSMEDVITLLREEEEYWPEDVYNTNKCITRLRKIYYDMWGWNKELIRSVAGIKPRYKTTLIQSEQYRVPIIGIKVPRYFSDSYEVVHYRRLVAYRFNDRIYPERAGQMAWIYDNDNQEVLLPSGIVCDVSHVLSGVDAMNHPQPVSPLPNWLFFLKQYLPFVDKNYEATTWLGDIASASAEVLFTSARLGRSLTNSEIQPIINKYASGPDMIGNIDSYVIWKNYNIASKNGLRFTDILRHYYLHEKVSGLKNLKSNEPYRYTIFCEAVGLKGWNGKKFANRKEWVKRYTPRMLDATLFYMMTRATGIEKILQTVIADLGFVESLLNTSKYLQLFVEALEKAKVREV